MPPMIFGQSLQWSTPNSSSAGLFYDAASRNSEQHNQDLSEDETSYFGESHPTSSPQQPNLSSHSQPYSSESSNGDTESTQGEDSQGELHSDLFTEDESLETDLNNNRGSLRSTTPEPEQPRIPKSQEKNYTPPFALSICKESVAIKELLDLERQNYDASSNKDDATFEELELSNFVVYLPPDNHRNPCEMRGLQHLTTKIGHGSFYFDGILSAGGAKRYVQGVPFKICSIGNYGIVGDHGEDIHEVGAKIWIESDLNSKSKSNVYYRLATPASEYQRFHDGFLWLADLAKHFVDFCQARENPVSINDFRSHFYNWLQITHQAASTFNTWYGEYGKEDFRHAIVRNIEFLFKESVGVEGGRDLRSEPIWNEVKERDCIPIQQLKEKKTVVTPYVYECFKDMKLGEHLLLVEPSSISEIRQTQQGKALDLTVNSSRAASGKTTTGRMNTGVMIRDDAALQAKITRIAVGDVVSVLKDGHSVWKDESSPWKAADDSWYLYVQGVHVSQHAKRSFDGIWLYRPSDTSCARMKYPFPNELFMSDNCTCKLPRITEDDILDVVSVLWHGHPSEAGKKLFIRQTYLENERFVTYKEAHNRCKHLDKQDQNAKYKYPLGQTVLVHPPKNQNVRDRLEPYEVIKYISEGSKEMVILRRLQRRRDPPYYCGKARPNELVYTDQTDQVAVSRIERTCIVRIYTASDVEEHRIPPPYNRDGSGNAFYITRRLIQHNNTSTLIPIEEQLPKTLIQGFDPSSVPPREQLRGMDLYCGGGNFGRGIEEGGAVRMTSAVDIARNQIHTYRVNQKKPDSVKLFYGSVDDLLKQALEGNPDNSELIPLPGDIDFICAGSPCQGFSILNSKRNNDKGRKNQSLVASVAAYVDFYRPKYGILENVLTMVQNVDECALSQLICAIVGMGYQVQLFLLDAWSCGSPQTRSRIFVSFAAPGLEPLEHPKLSHSHPSDVKDRGLGKSANGEAFARRIFEPTPFEYVTARAATKDLPRIGDGITAQCTSVPDHVIPRGISKTLRSQILAIPRIPLGMNFAKAWKGGHFTAEQKALFPSFTKHGKARENTSLTSKAWGRVHPRKLFSTVVVSITAPDSRTGSTLHWDEHRYLTTMEARRAQGFPDDELLLGSPDEGWKIMGNSVCRTVSMALGLSLREAWLANNLNDVQPQTKVSRPLPFLTRPQNIGRSSAIQVVIPFKPELSKDTTKQVQLSANAKIAPKSPVNTCSNSLASIKAPLTQSVLDSESSNKLSDPLEEFDESSSEKTFYRVSGSVKTPRSQHKLIPSSSDPNRNSQANPMPIKRTYATLQQQDDALQERTRKVPRVVIYSSSSSSVPSSRASRQPRPLNPSKLTKKLSQIQKDRMREKGGSPVDADRDGSSDSDMIYLDTNPAHASRTHSTGPKGGTLPKTIQKATKANNKSGKTPSKPQPKKVEVEVISLLTDDEDGDMNVTALPNRPSSGKYVPVGNSEFMPYAQTHRFLRRA